MSLEDEQNLANPEQSRLLELANDLEALEQKKTGGKGDTIIQKLIKRLREQGEQAAKVFVENESDKFSDYRNDGIPLIIEKLYGGTGSPWFMAERKMKRSKPPEA